MSDHDPQPDCLTLENGAKAFLSFSDGEFNHRLVELRGVMARRDLPAILFTSMQCIAYYTGFLYCAFGRPYGCVVTADRITTVSANIDGGQPWRRGRAENLIYTDWRRDNFWRTISRLIEPAGALGVEGDHLTLAARQAQEATLGIHTLVDIAPAAMSLRFRKSAEEIALIRVGAEIADLGGAAIRAEIREGAREHEIAMADRAAMERETARRFPESELRDTWVWLQSGLNTDGAHNSLTTRRLRPGDIHSLNAFPMISGYYTALDRTLFLAVCRT